MHNTTQVWIVGLSWLSSAFAAAADTDGIARIGEVLLRAEQSLAQVEPADLRQGLRQSVEQAKALVALLTAAKRGDEQEVCAQLTRRQPGDSEAAETARRRERERIVQSLLAQNALSEAAVVAAAGEADAVLLARVAAAQADAGQSESAAANFLCAATVLKPGDSARVPRQADDDVRRRDIAFIMRPQIQSGDRQGAARTARGFSSLLLRAMALAQCHLLSDGTRRFGVVDLVKDPLRAGSLTRSNKIDYTKAAHLGSK